MKQASVAVLLFIGLANGARADPQRHWYTLSIDDQRVGYASQQTIAAHGEIKNIQYVRIDISQFRRRSAIDRQVEVVRAADGRPLRIAVASKAGADRGAWRGEFDPRLSRLAVFAADSTRAVDVSLPPQIELPDRLFNALTPLWKRSVTSLTIAYLDPAQGEPTQLEAFAVDDEPVNGIKIDMHIKRARSAHRETLWFDTRGNLLRLEQPFFGAVLTWRPCATDCDRDIERPFDPMARLTVRSPFRIPPAALKGTIRYIIARSDEAEPRLIETGEQSIARDGHRSVVTVCDRCGPDASIRTADLAPFLAPNAWVQSSHPEIRAFARLASASGSIDRRMSKLTEAVRARMTGRIDFLGYASALEALRHRSGDCTEIALLLAAAARAEGIPARIVIGLVYADRFSGKKDVFSPHAWVQAWDGERWTSYDAALAGFDATHIAMAIGDGDPTQFEDAFSQLPKWRIENAGFIKSR